MTNSKPKARYDKTTLSKWIFIASCIFFLSGRVLAAEGRVVNFTLNYSDLPSPLTFQNARPSTQINHSFSGVAPYDTVAITVDLGANHVSDRFEIEIDTDRSIEVFVDATSIPNTYVTLTQMVTTAGTGTCAPLR